LSSEYYFLPFVTNHYRRHAFSLSLMPPFRLIFSCPPARRHASDIIRLILFFFYGNKRKRGKCAHAEEPGNRPNARGLRNVAGANKPAAEFRTRWQNADPTVVRQRVQS